MLTLLLLALLDISLVAVPPAAVAPPPPPPPAAEGEWTQWGGPTRDFRIATPPALSTSWPASGPPRLWTRTLGDGYSSVVAAGNSLYTMYRRGQQDVVIALDAASGKTLWEVPIDAPQPPGYNMSAGPGPFTTPLIVGNRLFTVTVRGHFVALDRQTGKRLWAHDLWKEYSGTAMDPGYAMSPIAQGDTVIVTAGGKGHALMAFRQDTGAVVWSKGDFGNSPSSPLLLRINGRQQLVNFMAAEVVGFDPATGDVAWSHPHRTQYDLNVAQPAWCEEDGVMVLASAYDGGARGIRPTGTGAKELWNHNRLRVHHGNMICMGGVVYGASGDFGPAPLTAVDAKTGQVLWQNRTFQKALLLQLGDMFLMLDEDGTLALARPSRAGLQVLTQAQVLEQHAWTPPTLVGTRLYVRDRKNIAAFELK
jgi:outer membrane protein assembly factor BamB